MLKKRFENWCKRQKNNYYPCLCETISSVLFWNRILGILPIVCSKKESHGTACKFEVSKRWVLYSYFIQIIYIPFNTIAIVLRFWCGPQHTKLATWYVMTFGYVSGDLNNTVLLIAGLKYSKEIADILEALTTTAGPIGELKHLKKMMTTSIVIMLGGFSIVFLSFVYVAWLRKGVDSMEFSCHLLDKPSGVVLRGFGLIFPAVNMSLIMLLCLLISSKLRRLGDKTMLTLEANIETLHPQSEITTVIEEKIPSATNIGLVQLAENYRKVSTCLKQINRCLGLQILSELSTNLYTIVYYLYRYSTATNDALTANNRERWHYIIGLLYRIAKLITFVVLGHTVSNNSNKPLEALQKARIINLPARLQQQVQSLILQWSHNKLVLSAFGVVNVGPWLIAPIVGNIITYLLVALQFEQEPIANLSPNVTAILESIF